MIETEIDEGAWAERYVTGRLEGADLERFEAHLVDCPACLDRVDAAARLGAMLRRAEQAPLPAAAPRRARPHWARRVAGWSALAAAVVLAVGSWVVARRARQAEAELASRLSSTEQQLAQARQEIDRARAPVITPAPAPALPRSASVPVLVLLATRGSDVPVLRLPEPGQPVVLTVEREDPPRFSLYRATLQTRAGAAVWQGTVAPGSREAVFVGIDSALIAPGEYQLQLEGQGRGGRWTPVGDHRFRTVFPDSLR
jgi:hypothetical protein